ncbi:MAG TPA: PCRF domain-containing protein, partial [Candidatus Eisenbacteria bacterium]
MAELMQRMASVDFWDDAEAAKKVVGELKAHRQIVEPWKDLRKETEEAEGMLTLVEQEPDEALAGDLERQSKSLEPRIQALALRSFLHEASDAHGAILTIHPGAGGTESQDWAQML